MSLGDVNLRWQAAVGALTLLLVLLVALGCGGGTAPETLEYDGEPVPRQSAGEEAYSSATKAPSAESAAEDGAVFTVRATGETPGADMAGSSVSGNGDSEDASSVSGDGDGRVHGQPETENVRHSLVGLALGDSYTKTVTEADISVTGEAPCAGADGAVDSCEPRGVSAFNLFSGTAGGAGYVRGPESTVEEVLERGLELADASPVHIVVRGASAADSIRCGWRGNCEDSGAEGAGHPILAGLGPGRRHSRGRVPGDPVRSGAGSR